MDKKFLARLSGRAGAPDLPGMLAERLSMSDLNSLLLEVFHRKTGRFSAPDVLRAYRNNRFVQPADTDAIKLGEFALNWHKGARNAGFQPIQLSPLCPLGTCSVVATAHQHKIVSASRGTEVVADATNVMAMESACRRLEQGFPATPIHFSTVHRHVRAQEVPKVPGFSAHFTILGLSSAGRDTGSFSFESESLLRHLRFYKTYLEEQLQLAPVLIRLKALNPEQGENRLFRIVYSRLQEEESGWPVEIIHARQNEQPYYDRLQFKIVIPAPDGPLEIADGGFTDWTRQLTGNRKERLLISGLGLEYLFRIRGGY